MEESSNEVKHCKNLPFVKHHQDVYGGHFPIWAAVELMTFGNITSIFDIMKQEDQKSITSFYGTSPYHLKSWMLAANTGIANIMQAKKHAKIETSDFFVTFFISKPPFILCKRQTVVSIDELESELPASADSLVTPSKAPGLIAFPTSQSGSAALAAA